IGDPRSAHQTHGCGLSGNPVGARQMQDFQIADQTSGSANDASGVVYFASQVVSLLAERSVRGPIEPRESLIDGLINASLSGAKDSFADLLGEMKRNRVSVAALADVYIPIAARRMGEAWHDDRMSWIDVSLGVARLQSLLREIGIAWAADQAGDTGHGTVLLIIPDREQHTLGPMVAMGQMRRFGVSVCLRIAPSQDELRSLVTSRNFDGVMISVAVAEKLELVRKTVAFLKSVSSAPLPVIVGGAVMTTREDAAECTGADLASNDIGVALESLGLKFDAFCVLRRA
ncbi:MAG: cobalamin B12-binding domain-containing protein, partial [Paracoccaceae bacterium]